MNTAATSHAGHALAAPAGRCIVRLQGGLGNQLFQYAAGRALASDQGRALLLDPGFLHTNDPTITPRTYALQPFAIEATLLSDGAARALWLPRHRLAVALARRGLSRPGLRYVLERGSRAMPVERFASTANTLVLEGYWQSEQYFQRHRQTLLQQLTAAPSPGLQRRAQALESPTSVSVHVRRGDYVTNAQAHALHGVCDMAYYRRAFALLESQVAQPRYHVFTDDPAWVHQHRADFGRELHVMSDSSLPAHEELLLMARCSHHVLANSSFSWWGAWLGRQDGACTVAPRAWFSQDVDTTDLVPARWHRI